MTPFLLLFLASYLAGSIPFGFLIGKAIKGIDLRNHGSGNIGATNAGRVLGRNWGLICLALDTSKGLLPAWEFPSLFLGASDPNLVHATVLAGVATILGHMFPCWLGFRGGKGVATSLGVVVVISPWGLLVSLVVFASTFFAWRYVSLSSLITACGFSLFELIRLSPHPFDERGWSHALFAIAVPTLIFIQHRSNIRRLMRGEEPKFAGSSEGSPAGS